MVKSSWGTKRTCQSCGARFYDLQRDPIVCPKCAAVYDPESVLKTRRGRTVPVAEKIVPVKVPPPAPIELIEGAEVADEEIADQEEEEEDLIEDAEELGADEDVSQVIEKNDGEEER